MTPFLVPFRLDLEACGTDRAAVRAVLERVRESLGNDWLLWREHGLERPKSDKA